MYCNESGKYAIYQSDRYGFRNPDSEWDTPHTEWVLVGDSFTLGACVDSGEDIGGQIRLLRGESVLNLGSGGGSMLGQLALLKEYAVFRKPKIVLWVFFEGNDLEGLDTEILSPLLMNYLNPKFSQGLIHRQTEIDNRLNQYILKAKVAYEKNETDILKKMNRGVPVFRSFTEKTRMLRLFNIRRRLGVDTAPRYYNVRPLLDWWLLLQY